MRKEVIIAILVGLLIGVAAAFGIWRAGKMVSPKGEQTKGQPAVKETIPTVPQLLLVKPESDTIVSQDKITLEGKAWPSATLVILANTGEIIISANPEGNFSQEVKLEAGANEITVIAYTEQGEEARQTLTVVYSTEFPD